MDMSAFVAPKSDQMTADDLIAGPRTITVVKVAGTGNGEQPVAVHYDGDEGRPYKPCKMMRRIMVAAWGADASQYVGRSMTLYRDPKVKFGGMEVGGIRISAMSDIPREMVMALTVTKAKREPYKVAVLKAPETPKAAAAPDDSKIQAGAAGIVARIDAATSHAAFKEVTAEPGVVRQRAWLAKNRPDLAAWIDEVVSARLADFDKTDAEEGIPA